MMMWRAILTCVQGRDSDKTPSKEKQSSNADAFKRLKVVVYSLPILNNYDNFAMFKPLACMTDLNIP